MAQSSSLTFPKEFPFEKQIEEALFYPDSTKIQTLMAVGAKARDVEKVALRILRDSEGNKSNLGEQNLREAKRWQSSAKGELDEQILRQIFRMEDPANAEENLRFYLAAGGHLERISETASQFPMPERLKQKALFLDILRRTVLLQKNYLESKRPVEAPKKSGFFSLFSRGKEHSDPTVNIQEEIAKVSALYRLVIDRAGGVKMLHQACASGLKDLVTELVSMNLEVNSKYPETEATPLHTASYHGNVELMAWLLDHGAEIDALTKTTEEQDRERKILKGHETPLHMAVMEGRKDAVAFLLSRGASTEIASAEGHTPLHYACFKDPEIAAMLMERGAKIDVLNNKGVTPLHYAALKGFDGLFKLLLLKGADPSVKDDYNQTPLQAVLDQGPKGLVVKLFEGNPVVSKLLSRRSLKEFLAFCKENPLELLSPPSQYATCNPLEVPFLFCDSELASFLKILMPPEDFALAFKELQKKYPKQNLKVLIDAGTSVDKKCVPKLDADQAIPPVPELTLETLLKRFGTVEFFTSPDLADVKQSEVYTNPEDEGSLMRRRVTKVEGKDGKMATEIVYDKEIPFSKLVKLDPAQIVGTEDGQIKVGEDVLPYVILKVGNAYMPVKLHKKDENTTVELRVELFNALFSEINFTDKDAPGYRDPASIIDSGSSKDAEPTVIAPEDLKRGIKSFCDAINFRIPYVGTPSEDQPVELEAWYKYLESIAMHDLLACLKEDIEAREAPVSGKPADPTPSAPSVIELAISGLHCGTRSLDDAQFVYDAKYARPKTVKDRVLGIIEKFKTGIASGMVDLENTQNVHVKNKILQVIDEECEITAEEKLGKYYFLDPISPQRIDRKKIMEIFWKKFISTAIIDRIDSAINGSPPEIDKELMLDWFKDNPPESWQAEKYAKIKNGFPDGERKAKADYLEQFDIFINPADLKKEAEPNWEKFIEDDRKYMYLQEVVQDQQTGKIKREAIISMLETFGVILKAG